VHHLRKCFENINKLEFDAVDSVLGIISAEEEKIPLRNYLARGEEVEVWFKDLEEAMKHSIKVVVRQSLVKYDSEDTKRSVWITEFPSQVILSLDSMYWTKITEENYLSQDATGDLQDWLDV